MLYRVGRITKNKIRLIIIKLNDMATENRSLKLRNLKVLDNDKETNIYTNPGRTKLELKAYKRLNEEIKQKRVIKEQNNLNIKYVLRNNKII